MNLHSSLECRLTFVTVSSSAQHWLTGYLVASIWVLVRVVFLCQFSVRLRKKINTQNLFQTQVHGLKKRNKQTVLLPTIAASQSTHPQRRNPLRDVIAYDISTVCSHLPDPRLNACFSVSTNFQ